MNCRADLLDAIQTGYASFRRWLEQVDEKRFAKPGALGNWSVADMLAHILVHEQRMVQWLAESLCAGRPVGPQPFDMPEPELTALNAEIHAENRGRNVPDLLRALDVAHHKVLELVDAAPEEFLFDQSRFHLRNGEPLWEAVAANTIDHYAEHRRSDR